MWESVRDEVGFRDSLFPSVHLSVCSSDQVAPFALRSTCLRCMRISKTDLIPHSDPVIAWRVLKRSTCTLWQLRSKEGVKALALSEVRVRLAGSSTSAPNSELEIYTICMYIQYNTITITLPPKINNCHSVKFFFDFGLFWHFHAVFFHPAADAYFCPRMLYVYI